jgi:hypothetical protein
VSSRKKSEHKVCIFGLIGQKNKMSGWFIQRKHEKKEPEFDQTSKKFF